jgi:hypothetical protein
MSPVRVPAIARYAISGCRSRLALTQRLTCREGCRWPTVTLEAPGPLARPTAGKRSSGLVVSPSFPAVGKGLLNGGGAPA